MHVDDREGIKPGAKYYEWELRGIPLRMELGPRDLDQNQACSCAATRARSSPSRSTRIGEDVAELLEQIQSDMLVAARERREANSIRGGITYDRFRE